MKNLAILMLISLFIFTTGNSDAQIDIQYQLPPEEILELADAPMRYFNALKGLGGISRLVVLPHESHGYSARESIMHMLWETDQWLEKWVKNK
jgi:hypothetical protein